MMTTTSIRRLGLGVACLSALAMASFATVASAASIADVAMMSGPDRQAKLEAGAKAEGGVNLYTTLIVPQAVEPLKAGWDKKYPNIKFNFYRADQAPLVQRIMSETRAGSPAADVVVGSTADALNRAQLLQSFTSPELSAFPKEYIGKDNLWAIYRLAYFGIGYNTKLVPEAVAPKSWEDLLDPKWNGKMIWATSRDTGGMFLIYHLRKIWGEKKAGEYFDKLATQRVAKSSASVRTLLDLVIAGEHAMLITTSLNHAIISKGEGAPVWFTSPDPVGARPDSIMVLNNMPHPHAAMLLTDYILSREGQAILAKAEYQVARRDVDPLPSMRPIIPELNGKTANMYPPEDITPVEDQLQAIFNKVSP